MFAGLRLQSLRVRVSRLIGLAGVAFVVCGAQLQAQQLIGVGLRNPLSSDLPVSALESKSAIGPSTQSASTARKLLGAGIGIALGGLAGYYLASATCNSCDDSGPAWYGAIIGASLGGVLGVVTATSFGGTTQRQSATYRLDTVQRLGVGDGADMTGFQRSLREASDSFVKSARK